MTDTTTVEARFQSMPGSGFSTTQWTLVRRAGQPASREALAALCQAYWHPIYAFMRGLGQEREDAQDLTQGFFASLFERDDLASLDPSRGSFRSWLRVCAKHFLLNDLKRRRAQRAGGGQVHVSIHVHDDDERCLALASAALTPDQHFDRSWALTVTERAMANVAAQYEREGRAALFHALRGTLTDEEPSVSDADLALSTGRTVGAIKTERCRRKAELAERSRCALRAEIAATVSGPHAIDAELRELAHALAT